MGPFSSMNWAAASEKYGRTEEGTSERDLGGREGGREGGWREAGGEGGEEGELLLKYCITITS